MSEQLGNIFYFLLLAGLFFLMMRVGCGGHIMGHGHHHGGKEADDRSSDGNLRWVAPKQAVDPVCGMTVQTAGAKSAVHDGQVYYFCSQDCRQKFEAAPASYVKKVAA
jgi:YHS domain-containing protein